MSPWGLTATPLCAQGTYKVYDKNMPIYEVTGNGHHGPDYVGVASVRSGKGLRVSYDQVHAARIV